MSSYATPGGLIALSVVLTTIGLITTGLRFHVRHLQKAKLLIDDWCVIPAEILLIGMAVAVLIGVAGHGLGRPVPTTENGVSISPDVIPSVMILTNKVIYALLTICWLQLGLTKLSLLFFYRRIFCTSKTNVMNFLTIVMIIITVIWSIAFFFANLFECGTVFQAEWDDNDEQAISSCVNEEWLSEAQFFSDFILDVILFLLPLPTVWKLNMPLKRRILVIFILAVGALTIVASTIKVVIIVGVVHSINNDFLSPDPDILNSIIIFWTIFESGLATIVISLPTLRIYLDKSPDLLRSLRSMISLQSLGSATRTRNNIRLSDERSTSSQADITKVNDLEEGMGNEVAMKDMPSHSLGSKSGIMIESDIRQDFDGRQNYESHGRQDA